MLFEFALIVKAKLAEQDAGGRGAMGDKYGKSLAQSLQNVILLAKRTTDELMRLLASKRRRGGKNNG